MRKSSLDSGSGRRGWPVFAFAFAPRPGCDEPAPRLPFRRRCFLPPASPAPAADPPASPAPAADPARAAALPALCCWSRAVGLGAPARRFEPDAGGAAPAAGADAAARGADEPCSDLSRPRRRRRWRPDEVDDEGGVAPVAEAEAAVGLLSASPEPTPAEPLWVLGKRRRVLLRRCALARAARVTDRVGVEASTGAAAEAGTETAPGPLWSLAPWRRLGWWRRRTGVSLAAVVLPRVRAPPVPALPWAPPDAGAGACANACRAGGGVSCTTTRGRAMVLGVLREPPPWARTPDKGAVRDNRASGAAAAAADRGSTEAAPTPAPCGLVGPGVGARAPLDAGVDWSVPAG